MDLNEIKTPHFSLSEMLRSDIATQRGIANTPSVGVLENICRLMTEVLEPARVKLDAPVIITSGYRSVELNYAVGGVANSQHVKGQAADLVCTKLTDKKRLFDILAAMDIDQILWETNSQGTQWIHVSYVSPDKNRHIVNRNYRAR